MDNWFKLVSIFYLSIKIMSLIKSHHHSRFEARFQYSQKVTFEPLEIEGGYLTKPGMNIVTYMILLSVSRSVNGLLLYVLMNLKSK